MRHIEFYPKPGDNETQLRTNAAELADILIENPDSATALYQYCLNLRMLGETEKALRYLESVPNIPDFFDAEAHQSAVGVLGFIGLAVLLNQGSPELVDYFRTRAREVGKSCAWADVRLAVPYALFLNRSGKADEAISILLSCIESGIVPEDVSVALPERISPAVLLLSLYDELGQEEEMYQFVGKMTQLLKKASLEMEQVFEVVYAQDPDLFDRIFAILKQRSPSQS